MDRLEVSLPGRMQSMCCFECNRQDGRVEFAASEFRARRRLPKLEQLETKHGLEHGATPTAREAQRKIEEGIGQQLCLQPIRVTDANFKKARTQAWVIGDP